jgi:cell division protein FtsZ
VLINITGGFDMTLYEVDAAANEIRAEVDPNANIILGSTFDQALEGHVRVSVVATGIDDEAIVGQQTIVQPARRAAEAPASRRFVYEEPAYDAMGDVYEEEPPRPARPPSFAIQEDAPERKGFNLFGWMKSGEAPRGQGAQRRGTEPAAPEPDPALDEELEIPAFLRRQMPTQR